MTASLGTALFDATRSTIFSCRNVDKTAQGDFVRGAVAAGQARNAIGAVASYDNLLGKAATRGVKSFDALAKAHSALGFTAKAVNIASKYVNPLLCVSGGVKVLKAKDKKTEAIKQSLALGTMFTFEKTARAFMTPEGRKFLAKHGITAEKSIFKKLVQAMVRLDNFAATSKWTRVLIPLLKGMSYVGLSITGYTLGTKLSDKINDSIKNHALVSPENRNGSPYRVPLDYNA